MYAERFSMLKSHYDDEKFEAHTTPDESGPFFGYGPGGRTG